MSLFKDMLKPEESLFKDEIALDYDYLPKLLPYREKEQFQIAGCIKPLFQKRNGKNLLIHGAPGIGKTAATRHILRDLENETDDIIPIYINCWKKNTTHKIILDICTQLNCKFLQNKTTEELLDLGKSIINKKSAVFIFDEVDKLEDFDFLYLILEEIYRKTILLITNYKKLILDLDERIKSRLTAELLEFKQYNQEETKGILKQRLSYAFVSNIWDDSAFELAANKAAELQDIRSGLYLLKESGLAAEEASTKKITIEHVTKAIRKLDEFSIKKSADLEDDTHDILELIKKNNNKKIGELYEIYKKSGESLSYPTFQRRINKLEKSKFISLTKTGGGEGGNTSIVKLSTPTKKLTDF